MAAVEQGFDPVLYPVGSLVRIAAVLKLDLTFVREKARDALGHYPEVKEPLSDTDVPRVVSACRPYLPKEEEWTPPDDLDDLPLDAVILAWTMEMETEEE